MTIHIRREEDYPALFRQNIMRSVQAIWRRAQSEAPATLTEGMQARIFGVLDYAFHRQEVWPSLSQLLCTLAPKFDLAGYRLQWLPYLEKGIAASQSYHDHQTEATLSCELGQLYQRLSQLDQAEFFLERAVILAEAAVTPTLHALALQRLAEVARLRRNYPLCAARLATATALIPSSHPAQAYGLFTAGKAAFDQHDYAAATAAFSRALALWQAVDNQGRMALCIQNLGRLAMARGEPQAAIPLYEQAIELLTATGDQSNLAIVQMNLGIAYYTCHEYIQSLALYEVAENSFHAMTDMRSLAMVCNNAGLAHAALGHWIEAALSLQRSIEIYQLADDKKAGISAKGNLGIVYLDQAQSTLAVQTFQEALLALEATERDPEYERLWQELTAYLQLAQQKI
ncbi:MAG: tetratricopeptide repeat protein [Caldilineaceae bacterium]|nr:tetratricopeptide repeat protein [Caldilineaceae bacterium]